jgi:hypothetical protein
MTMVLDGTSGITTNSGTVVSTTDATLNGLTVGKGGGSVSTNTAVGASALNATNTGGLSTCVGYNAGSSLTSGDSNNFVGAYAGRITTTGLGNVGIGTSVLYDNVSGSYNIAIGQQALRYNTASDNTAVGFQAAYSNSTGTGITALGKGAAYAVTGNYNTILGWRSGEVITSGQANTIVGALAGSLSTGSKNTFVGGPVPGVSNGCASAMTTGSSNTIIGNYNGNQGGLDIRTSSNYIVLSDGDGNPQAYCNGSNQWFMGKGGTSNTADGYLALNGSTYTGQGPIVDFWRNGSRSNAVGSYSYIKGGTGQDLLCMNTSGVYLSGGGATSWTSASDERLKENLVPIENGLEKVATLRAVIGNYISDEEKTRKPFLIAQDVQAVLPEAITSNRQSHDDETEYLGIAYTEIIPLLVASIKELKAIVDAQAVEIAELKGRA